MNVRKCFFTIGVFILSLSVSCILPPGKNKTDEILNAYNASWDKIHSGSGSYEYKYMNVTHLLLKSADIKKAKEKIDEYYIKNPGHTSGVRSYVFKKYLFSGYRFKCDLVTNDKDLIITDTVSFDGAKTKVIRHSFQELLKDSLKTDTIPVGYIFTKPSTPYSDNIEFDPFYIPKKELLSSLMVSIEKRVSISSYEIDQKDKNKYSKVTIKVGDSTEHSLGGFTKDEISLMIDGYKGFKISSIKNKIFDGKQYIVVTCKGRGTKKRYYIDPQRDYRVFYITEQSGNEENFTKIDYQKIDGLLFPKHIESYMILDGFFFSYRELNFNSDWKLNIETTEKDFDLVFPTGIDIFENGQIVKNGNSRTLSLIKG